MSNQTTNGASMKCPQCGQMDRVTRVQLLYEGGIRVSETRGTARRGRTVVSADGIVRSGRTSYSSKTKTQSALSAKLAPPKKPDSAGILLVIAGALATLASGGYLALLNLPRISAGQTLTVGTASFAILLGGLLALVFGVIEMTRWYGAAGQKERAEYEAAAERWQKECLCQRCGIRFVPGEQAVAR